MTTNSPFFSFELFARGQANRGKEMKVFDWEKAAKLIKERQPDDAYAGLSEDWEYTRAAIWENNQVTDDQGTFYFASTWATPILVLHNEDIECWRMESEVPEWNARTWWPESALKIINNNGGI